MEFKGWPVCRIDGNMGMAERKEDIRRFTEGGDAPDAPRLFLLSTRSGGLGLNLVAADTVIFYDQDWVSFSAYVYRPRPLTVVLPDRTHKRTSKPKIVRIASARQGPC